jgi:TPR repeat protein
LLAVPAGVSALAHTPDSSSDNQDPMATLMDEPGSTPGVAHPQTAAPASRPSPVLPPPLPVTARAPVAKSSPLIPITIVLAVLLLLGGGGAYVWLYFIKSPVVIASAPPSPKPEEPAPTPEPEVTTPPKSVAPVSLAPEPVMPAPVPKPTPAPAPTPPPNPLAAGLAEAQRLATSENWSDAMTTLIALARRFPEETEPRRRLETICARFIRDEKPADRDAFEKIRVPLEDAAALGITSGIVLLAENLRTTDAVRALDLYEKAAVTGDVMAMRQGGLLYANRKEPGDMARAITWFERGANMGDAACAYLAGESYLLGKGVARDTVKGLEYLNQSAGKDYPRAIDRLGDYYYKETKDYAKALAHFDRARRLDWGPSFGNLGVLYVNGAGVPADPAAAASLFRQGAEKGDASSMFYYAQCLEAGVGLEADPAEARKWYEQAAAKGDTRAVAKLREAAK